MAGVMHKFPSTGRPITSRTIKGWNKPQKKREAAVKRKWIRQGESSKETINRAGGIRRESAIIYHKMIIATSKKLLTVCQDLENQHELTHEVSKHNVTRGGWTANRPPINRR